MTRPAGHAGLLLDRLDALAQLLAARGDVLALLAVGSVGQDVEVRLDEHSDLDFFVVTDDDAKSRYLTQVDWLAELAPVVYDFVNTDDGRKVLFADGVYAEYAVFTLAELRAAAYHRPRVLWRREDAPDDLATAGVPLPRPGGLMAAPAWQLNEALTNLYIGLHREARGERLGAMRLIQVHALDRLLDFLELTSALPGSRQDPFAVERGLERRLLVAGGASADGRRAPGPPSEAALTPSLLAQFVPGYEHNRAAAVTALRWWQEHGPRLGGEPCFPHPAMVAAIEELLR